MSGDWARSVLTECGDGKGEVRTSANHGVHDVSNLALVLRSFNSFGGVGRTRRENGSLHRREDPLSILQAEVF